MSSVLFARPTQLLFATLLFSGIPTSESRAQSEQKTGHTVSLGLVGAAQQSAFRVTDGNATYQQRIGWASGASLTIPLGRFFSLEPQMQYSSIPSLQTDRQRPRAFLADATVNWLSVPIALKVHLGLLALTLGGQVDYPIAVVDSPNVITKDQLPSISYAATGGVELFPRSRVTLYGRYIYGLTNVDGRELATPTAMLYNQTIQAGLKLRLLGGKRAAPSARSASANTEPPRANAARTTRRGGAATPARTATVLVDGDGDKVADAVDKCPTVFGAERNAGCPSPDTDDDGVTDTYDKCPQTAGPLKNEGCPSVDSDKDGITDADDKCPTVIGTAQFAGCLPPDGDRDGVVDAEDRCPAVAGASDMMGCPRISTFTASAVTFARGRSTLTIDARRELDKVVEYLIAYPNVSVRIEGHTDNESGDLFNNPLSERRASAAKAYLLTRGIAETRLTTIGHGSARPTIGNGTAEGRARNRRVEVVVR